MHTDDVRLGAFLAAHKFPVLGITINSKGYGVLEFPEEARALVASFQANDPVPVRTVFECYRLLMKRVAKVRLEQRVTGGQHV